MPRAGGGADGAGRAGAAQIAERNSIADRRLERIRDLYPGLEIRTLGFGNGDGVTYIKDQRVQMASEGVVSAVVYGDEDSQLSAEKLVKGELALSELGGLEGGFFGVMYDAARNSVCVFRDKKEHQEGYFAFAGDGFLMFATEKKLMQSLDKSLKALDGLSEFPGGKVLVAGGGVTAQVHAFEDFPEAPEGTPADADGKVLAPGQRYGGESVILTAGNLVDKESWSAVVGTELVDSPTKKSLSSHAKEIIAMQRWIQGS